MSWKDLLDEGHERVLPWFGPRVIHNAERTWVIHGDQPSEHGWYRFNTSGGRTATLMSDVPEDINLAYEKNQPTVRGYIVGDRIIKDTARVELDPTKLIKQTSKVRLVEPGLVRFARGVAVQDRDGHLIYMRQEFPLGAEQDVLDAYQDRLESVDQVPSVTPPLDLAFRWLSYQRELAEERRRKLERIRAEEEAYFAEQELIEQAMKDAGTAIGRRVLAERDFESAAREALRVSGAELLDVRDSANRGEMVVQYRFKQQRLECVVDNTMRVIDAGICLEDHDTGEKGDTFFTLESLPGVVGEAMDLGKLVVWRHV